MADPRERRAEHFGRNRGPRERMRRLKGRLRAMEDQLNEAGGWAMRTVLRARGLGLQRF